jgi:WD40 repeat protein
MAFTHDDAKLATASDDGVARVWDLSNGEELFAFSGMEA